MKKLRWGIVGAGDIVRKRVAPALQRIASAELVGICRAQVSKAQSFANEFGIPKAYGDLTAMLADPQIDAVYIASPVFLHQEQTIAAAKAGKHVLCEKPLALNPDDSRAMKTACDFHGVTLGVAYYRRFYPVLGRVRELLANGEIGAVTLAQMNAFEFFDPPQDHPRAWLLDPARNGGGPMMDFGCHRIEVLTDLFGDVDTVVAVMSDEVFKRRVEETAIAVFKFENGMTASLAVSHAVAEAHDTLEIFGTRGSLRLPRLNGGELIITRDGVTTSEQHPPHDNIHLPLIEDFNDAVLDGRAPRVDAECGIRVDQIESRIYESARGGAVE